MKKLAVALLLASIAIFSICSVSGADADEDEQAIIIDGIHYDTIDGRAIVSGTDEVSPPEHIVIPEFISYEGQSYPVEAINPSAFAVDGIVSISIPKTVNDIGMYSIRSMTLQEITVDPANEYYSSSEGVLYDVFKYILLKYPAAKTDESFYAPRGLIDIDMEAFLENKYVKEIDLPDTVKTINASAFDGCSALEKLNYDGTYNKLPKDVLIVETRAFAGCTSLKELVLNQSLKVINAYAFLSSGLEYVYLPFSISSIEEGAFSGCPLKTIDSDNNTYLSIDNVLYEIRSNTKTLLAYPAGTEAETFIFPSDVNYIGSNAFNGCQHLKTVELNNGLNTITSWAFNRCKSLETVKMSSSIIIVEGLAFYECENLKNIEFGTRTSVLEPFCFSDTGVVDLVIPDTITNVGLGAFSECKNLRTVEFSDSSVFVDQDVFVECFNLESIYIPGSDVTLVPGSFGVGNDSQSAIVTLTVNKDLQLPNVLGNDYTTLEIVIIGERPYPYENLIGVAVCIAILVGIIYAVREV